MAFDKTRRGGQESDGGADWSMWKRSNRQRRNKVLNARREGELLILTPEPLVLSPPVNMGWMHHGDRRGEGR